MAIPDVILGFLNSWKTITSGKIGKNWREKKKKKKKEKQTTKQTSYSKSISEAPWCIQAGEE